MHKNETPKSAAAIMTKEAKEHVLITLDTKSIVNNTYNVYLDNHVSYAEEYRSLTEFLFNATENDTFNLFLNGPGGHCNTCTQVVHAIANTEAKVVGHLLGEASSSHANIFLACHDHVVFPYSMLMIHTFSGGFWGKGHDSERASKAMNQLTRSLYSDLYTGFLTEEEIEDVLVNNKDLYFVGQDIADRFKTRYAYIDMLNEAAQEQAESEAQDNLVNICVQAGVCDDPRLEENEDGLSEEFSELVQEAMDKIEEAECPPEPDEYPEDTGIDPSK